MAKRKKQKAPEGFTQKVSSLLVGGMRDLLYWPLRHWWKVALAGSALLLAYALYLDGKILSRLADKPWQIPTQIFARALVLSEGQAFDEQRIIKELRLLAYRQTSEPIKPGDYAIDDGVLRFYRRGFNFPTGYQAASLFEVAFKNERVTSITDQLNQHRTGAVRIEPWLIGRLHTDNREDRLFVPLEEIPEALIQGLTLVEDKQFFEHHGISLTSILRALVRNIQAGKTVQGGSTLTQQLIKNLFLSREKSIIRKAQEAMMALLIELRFSKERILELYLNEVYLGQNGAYGIHGFGLASEFYFGAPLNELQLHQISTLIGMVKGPFLYHPRRSPTLTQERRDLVLRLMFENKLISRWKYQSQIMQPLKTTDYQSQNQYAALMDKVKRELDVALNHKLQRTNGLSVFTSFDPHMQVAAQNAVQTSISTITKSKDVPALQGAMVVSDYTTGQIKAIVGDKNGRISGFNRAIDARRPIGSLIKPLVYLLALEQSDEFNLASVLKDEPIKLRSSKEDIWQPQNADKQYRGQVLMLDALRQSLNVPTVNLGMQVGVENVVNQLKNIGVDEAVQQYPAVLLGSVNLSSLAVSQVFQTIANEGQWRPLHSVRAVMNDDGRLIWLHAPQFQNKVDKAASQLVKYAMQQVVTAGTGKQVGSIFADYGLAGKTGTTDDNRDSWFMGMDGRHNVVTWIGNDDNLKTGLTGASGAMQAYIGYAQSENLTPMTIDWVPSVTFNHAHQQTGKLFTQACADTVPIPIISSSRNVISDGDCGPKSKPKKKSFWQRLWGKGE